MPATHQQSTGLLLDLDVDRAPRTALNPQEAQLAQEELVLALVTTGEPHKSTTPPWGLLENAYFQRAMQRLQPGFVVPSAYEVRQRVLPHLYGQTKREVGAFLQAATSLTVVCSTQGVAGHRRRLMWTAVDQDGRSELLVVVPRAPAEYPEEVADRVLRFLSSMRLPRRPGCLVHLCNESVGASHLARSLLKKRQQGPNHSEFEATSLSSIGFEASPLALMGGCMAQQMLFLFRDVLETLSSISEALDKCMDIVAFVTSSTAMQHELVRLNGEAQCLPLPSSSPRADDFHSFIVCVRQVLALKGALRSTLEESAESGGDLDLKPHLKPEAATAASSRTARAFVDAVGDDLFWLGLDLTAQVLQPFAYTAWLSECSYATSSAQLLLCWLLLLAVVRVSPMVLDTEKDNFHMRLVDRIRGFSEDHVLACLLLDPRVHGLGLSALGRRRTRLIVADLGEKLQGRRHRQSGMAEASSSTAQNRSRLVEQLLQYLNRERPFDDDEAWETMTTTTVPPRLFWLEYAEEAPELAQVALAVLGFRAFVAPLEATWRMSTQRFRPQRQQDEAARGDGVVLPVGGVTAMSASEVAVPPVELIRFHHDQLHARLRSEADGRRRLAKYGSGRRSDGQVPSLLGGQSSADLMDDEADREPSDAGGDAVTAFRQLKSWLQRLDEHEKSLPVDDADASLQRFDADWLELGPDSPQQIRACLERFLLGDQHQYDGEDGHDDGQAALPAVEGRDPQEPLAVMPHSDAGGLSL
ncbi:hypothetical protein BBJ28_00006237 [Nothophytophthora sp. Chile5]|nr:hypothetical protein BBJ28_00006237 [Nothophytophthora sp. Chile5]